jgi:hypothetical protein
MKKATLKESEATYDDKLAMIMAVGDATIEEASRALDECDDDIDGALALVYDQAPPPSTGTASSSSSLHNAPYKLARKGRHMEDADDETIAKPRESLMGAASNAARRQPFVAAAAAPKDPKDNGKNHVLNWYSLLNTMSHEYFFSVSCVASAHDNISHHPGLCKPKC